MNTQPVFKLFGQSGIKDISIKGIKRYNCSSDSGSTRTYEEQLRNAIYIF